MDENETSEAQHTPGFKDDRAKPKVWQGIIRYFPLAIREVSHLSELGSYKYTWGGWAHVEDGRTRYSDALGRHLVDECLDANGIDPSDGIYHDVKIAWNALARLEIRLRARREAQDKSQGPEAPKEVPLDHITTIERMLGTPGSGSDGYRYRKFKVGDTVKHSGQIAVITKIMSKRDVMIRYETDGRVAAYYVVPIQEVTAIGDGNATGG